MGLYARLSAWLEVPPEFAALRGALADASTSLLLLSFEIILVTVLTAGTFLVVTRQVKIRSAARGAWQRFFFRAAAAVAALAIGFAIARLLADPGLPLTTLRVWTVITVIGSAILFLMKAILMASRRPECRGRSFHMSALARDLQLVIAWTMMGFGLLLTLQLWRSGPGLIDLTRTFLVGIPAFLLFSRAVWRHKRAMASAVAGPGPRSRWRTRLAKSWPGIVIGFLGITFLSSQIALTLGAPLPGPAVALTALMLFLTPHLDTMIASWAQRELESPKISILAAAGRQTARFAILIGAVAMLGTVWATPLALGLGFELRSVAREAFQIAVISLVAAFLWNVVGTLNARALIQGRPALEGDNDKLVAPRSRLGTIVPLLSVVGKSSILMLALLSILVSLDINVWPLITGLSVFGLAIGFGSQTLVKDVVSGLFFLIDDAFRFGEYIETSGAKGTVEKISIRSVSLRNSRGSIATVPYGQIGKIQNFSRDWAIEKLTFRVAFDTDVELVRKLFKKIGQDIAADPELAPDLIEPFKSKGIGDVEDGTLIIKAAFTAKPGKQSMIRRAALTAVQNAFRENGIYAVPKPLTHQAEPTAG
ncbi:mechanosensitive ion channel family protein [Rhizobium sp. T136]|uniref:mechanosensitive ion channel family protein n=1 Tax=Rhizobium sp. T136 TaxID=555319 RepID=UPI001E58D43E|nr:mechanosensitive ion channel family protein [Rhizobium sp. T136]UFS84082.1 mechanosensitive ion channel family protein [Rhizobium sp. T136]